MAKRRARVMQAGVVQDDEAGIPQRVGPLVIVMGRVAELIDGEIERPLLLDPDEVVRRPLVKDFDGVAARPQRVDQLGAAARDPRAHGRYWTEPCNTHWVHCDSMRG